MLNRLALSALLTVFAAEAAAQTEGETDEEEVFVIGEADDADGAASESDGDDDVIQVDPDSGEDEDGTDESSEDDEGDDFLQTEQVVVTGSRTEQRLADAPVATMTVLARISESSVQIPNGRPPKSTRVASPATNSAPNRAACFLNSSIISGPWIPSGNPG